MRMFAGLGEIIPERRCLQACEPHDPAHGTCRIEDRQSRLFI